MDFCLLKDNVVVGTVATMDPHFQPPEGFTLGPKGGPDHYVWDGERYSAPLARRGYYAVIPKAFSAEECDAILAMSGGLPLIDGKVIKDGKPEAYLPEIRLSRLGWLRPGASPEVDALFDKVWSIFRRQNEALFQHRLQRIVQLQFTKYEAAAGGHFDWHTDALVTDDGLERKLSFVLLLSDPDSYAGGVFELQDIGKIDLVRGAVLIFSPPLLHRVTPVTAGVRHSLVTWVQGPIDPK